MNRREFVVGAVTLPLALRFAPEALAGGTPVALVTADTESRVAVVELSTGKVLRSIRTLAGPRSIETVLGIAGVVCHTVQGAVSIIDGPKLVVRHVLHGFDEPRYTAAAPNGRHAFITDSGRNEVVTIDVVEGRKIGRLAVGGPARHVSIDRSGRILWGAPPPPPRPPGAEGPCGFHSARRLTTWWRSTSQSPRPRDFWRESPRR